MYDLVLSRTETRIAEVVYIVDSNHSNVIYYVKTVIGVENGSYQTPGHMVNIENRDWPILRRKHHEVTVYVPCSFSTTLQGGAL